MNHPRRAEVLGRDNGLNREINNDAGHLNGQYGQLKKSKDQGIRAQEQTEAGSRTAATSHAPNSAN